jgi:hypothetical protein
MRIRLDRTAVAALVVFSPVTVMSFAPDARGATDSVEIEDRGPERSPSIYSVRAETGVGVIAGQVSGALELHPLPWLSVGVHGGWMGQWLVFRMGHAYGAGPTIGGRLPFRFGYLTVNAHGGWGRYSESDDPPCMGLGSGDGSSSCPSRTDRSGSALLLGGSAGVLFNAGKVQVGPLFRFDHIYDINVATINVAVVFPRS